MVMPVAVAVPVAVIVTVIGSLAVTVVVGVILIVHVLVGHPGPPFSLTVRPKPTSNISARQRHI
jgi:uncharacterized membrane protein